MGGERIGVVLHGVTGRMGEVAHAALCHLQERGGVQVRERTVMPVPIGLGRDAQKLEAYAQRTGLASYSTNIDHALAEARAVNPEAQLYHNAVSTGARLEVLREVVPKLDPSTTGVFCEKPIAADYAEGRRIVATLEHGCFMHGVVHDMLETPGVRKALELLPRVKPTHCHMVFGYEVGDGMSGNSEFRGQRPDFNWTLEQAGGGIILDMCHEAYLSRALFGATDRLSAVARLLVPRRKASDGQRTVECNVEDYVSIRREHASGVVNTSLWTWLRRVNSEFGPLEITVDGHGGTIVFGLHGLKAQWRESAPALHWRDALAGQPVAWRDHWEVAQLTPLDAFAAELARFIRCLILREPYAHDATVALDWLGEVEAIYQSAAAGGAPFSHETFLHYPDRVPDGWQPERLQNTLNTAHAPPRGPGRP